MSGGVDSSTVAAILKNEGHDIFGITMLIHEYSESSIINAKKVCEKLGIQHFILDVKTEFKKYVMDTFVDYYANGFTPNPCVFCNRDIKLNLLLHFAKEKGADLMATGHYANLNVDINKVILSEARNKSKDQSYFLSLVNRENLKYVRFPLGNITDKSETRKIAASFGLHNFEKKDSQDICFIPSNNYKEFLKSYCPKKHLFQEGNIKLLNTEKTIGKHNGIANYTIGQRKGLGIAYEKPLYVIKINSQQNEIIVGTKEHLERKSFCISNTNWILDYPDVFEGYVKLRSFAKKTKAKITKQDNSKTSIEFLENSLVPVTNGQICAIYNYSNEVIGAGIICS